MIKYCLDRWNKNQQTLRDQLEKDTSLNWLQDIFLDMDGMPRISPSLTMVIIKVHNCS